MVLSGALLDNCGTMRTIQIQPYSILLLSLLLTACITQPVAPDALPGPELLAIQQAFETTVARARQDPGATWHSGPIGNLWVNYWGEPNYGLCYQWQKLVFQGVQQRVREVGWQATGIRINKDTDHEHHAVVVFNPAFIERDDLLRRPQQSQAYVLDPWRQGQADMYTLADWLKLPRKVEVPAQLKELEAGEGNEL